MERILNKSTNDYNRSKFSQYRYMAIMTIVISIVLNASFWIVDCMICREMSYRTFIPRCALLLILYPYIMYMKKKEIKSVRFAIALNYILLYIIALCCLWANSYIPTKLYIGNLFTMLQIAYLAVGMCAPREKAEIYHAGMLFECLMTQYFVSDVDLAMTLLIQIVTYLAIETVASELDKSFLAAYSLNNDVSSRLIMDPLTSAYNRNKLVDLTVSDGKELKNKRAGILLLDIDFFKKVNDTKGHDVGDIVLKNLVKIIRHNIRKSDYIIRWGGEEFLIIIPDCGEKKTREIAEAIRVEVESCSENMCNSTVSIGMVIYTGGDYKEAVKKADTATYYAKNHGRNQVREYNEVMKLMENSIDDNR